MLEAVRGHYKNGNIELYEKPQFEEGEIIVTFLNGEESGLVDLRARGITEKDAQNARSMLKTFETDWSAEGMELYDKV